MLKNKKATVKAAKNEHFNIYETTFQNYREDCRLAEVLDDLRDKKAFSNTTITLGQTPFSLRLGGANVKFDLVVTPNTLYKCVSSAEEKKHGHNLSVDVLRYLLYELRNPAMLLKGSHPNTLVAVTGLKDDEDRPIIVSIALNRRHQHHLTNQITSAYGRNRFDAYLQRQVEQGNIIAINKNKANRMFQSARLQLPIEETLISFDDSIAYSLENVKGFIWKKIQNSEPIAEVGAIYHTDELNEEFNRLVEKFKGLVSEGQELVDKVKFFDYAGEEIYDSMLWHKFQQDKDYLERNESVAQLENVLGEARSVVNKLEGNTRDKPREKLVDL